MAQVSLQRTAEELKNIEFNYFVAFKIDVTETDKTKIEQKIKMALSSTSGSVVGRRLNELKNDIIEIMCNDALFQNGAYVPNKGGRALEAAAAKKFKLNDAVHVIEILCQTRKTLLKSEVLDICSSANKPVTYFTEQEFFSAIDYLLKMGVKIVDNIDNQIPFADFQRIDKTLETEGSSDLYAFLGVSKTASTAEIQSKSDEKYSLANKGSDLKKKQTVSTLCSNIKKILLTSSQTRKAYDDYIVIRADVWDEFASRKSYGIKEITMDEYMDYTQQVMNALHISSEQAETMISIGCKYFQLTVLGKSDGNAFEYCPYDDCGKLYVKGAKSCPHCGRSLEIVCWNCHKQMRITKDDTGCPSCGATRRAHDLFVQSCQTLDQLINKPATEISALQTALLNVKNIVPNYDKAGNSAIGNKVKEYEAVIAARVKQEETVGTKYRETVAKMQELISCRKYVAALGVANSLQTNFNGYNQDATRKYINEITVVVQNAQREVNAAKQYIAQGNVNMAITYASKALSICDDLADARQILQKYPPKPVTNLRVSVRGGKARLEWEDNSQQVNVFYTVIKKIGVAPRSADDGAVVDKGLSVKFLEDASVVSATPYYYAVFAERYGINSALAVTTSPAVMFADVQNVKQEVVDSGVKVSWDTPQNVKSIEVWRNVGTVAPQYPGEGQKIDCKLDGFYDEKCTGNNGYLIVCAYEIGGKKTYSNGVCQIYKPYEEIFALKDVSIEYSDNRYEFSCAEGYVGKIRLYYSNAKLPIPTDKRLKFINFNTICKGLQPINAQLNAEGNLAFSLPTGQIFQIYPIVATEQLFVVSPPTLINTMRGLDNFDFSVNSGTVTVRGNLHPQAVGIVAQVSNTEYKTDFCADCDKFTFKADEFRRSGKLEIKLKTNTVNYITLFVQFKTDAVDSYSQAIKLEPPIDYREAVTVLYNIEYKVSATKPFKLTVNFESEREVEIPKMLLMQGSPRPMNKNSGKLCERIDGVKLKKGLFSKRYTGKVTLTVPPTATNTKFALFLNDDGSHVQLKQVLNL